MKVRTVRKHINGYAPAPIKNVGRKYEPSDRDGRNLIAAGLVLRDEPSKISVSPQDDRGETPAEAVAPDDEA